MDRREDPREDRTPSTWIVTWIAAVDALAYRLGRTVDLGEPTREDRTPPTWIAGKTAHLREDRTPPTWIVTWIAAVDALAYRLGRTVDLGELSSLNLVFAAEVLSTGKQLFVSDPDAAATRAADLLSLYVRFNEDRKEVLDAYRAG